MKIAIYGQYYQNNTEPIIREIFDFFEKQNLAIYIESSFLAMLKEKLSPTVENISFMAINELTPDFDILISIGGDGTILRAATLVKNTGVPILGINAGRLGFLATVQKDEIHQFLTLIINKKYSISERTLLSLECFPENNAFKDINFAMNEITVSRKDTASMITIETSLNGEYLNSYWADGLIISTPTGSTGYSMSCGGPVLTPDVKSLVITPIAPHNLNARPLVIPDETVVQLKISGREEQYLVSLDSRIATLKNESVLTIRKTPFKIKMVAVAEASFLKTLRNKLLWGEDKRN